MPRGLFKPATVLTGRPSCKGSGYIVTEKGLPLISLSLTWSLCWPRLIGVYNTSYREGVKSKLDFGDILLARRVCEMAESEGTLSLAEL